MPAKKVPSKALFIIPAILFIIMVVGIVGFVNSMARLTGRQPNLTLPGEAVLRFEKAGNVEIYYEYTHSNRYSTNIEFSFENVETGETIYSYVPNMTSNYNTGNRQGELVAQAELPVAGSYLVTGSGVPAGSKLQFAVEQGGVASLLFGIFGFVFGLFAGIAAVVVLIIIIILRVMAKNKVNAPVYPYPPPGGAQYPPPGYPAYPPAGSPPNFPGGKDPYNQQQ